MDLQQSGGHFNQSISLASGRVDLEAHSPLQSLVLASCQTSKAFFRVLQLIIQWQPTASGCPTSSGFWPNWI